MSRCLGLKSCLDFACGLLVGRKPVLMAKSVQAQKAEKRDMLHVKQPPTPAVDSGSSAKAARSSLISSQKRMPCVAEIFLMDRYEEVNICKYINRYEARSTVYSKTVTVLIVPPQVDSDA